ncbi:Ribokinase-like protein [Gigaspora rosea]|uniref:ATP-dependent (S)-NAD(P)H-hydrate dehydratase n=1 Tax=Gigaspora rosea TaxID=44941 RepID=A0A397VHR1_9GLOM|nr:Ribokinase-like protein [Gigaspora rosea]
MTLTKPTFDVIRRLIPPLSPDFHKGQAGRVCVIGGSDDYTGAPYFSAISALKLGADMAHVVCQPTAAIAIKNYSPGTLYILVFCKSRHDFKNPDLTSEEIIDNVSSLFKRAHVLTIGPGLSRDKMMLECTKGIILKAKEEHIPMVIDADGLFLIQNNPDIIKDYSEAILTPNVNEFKRLCETMRIEFEDDCKGELAQKLSQAFGGVTIVQKGKNDLISNGNSIFLVDHKSGLKRCGGQGDILTGLISTFVAWGVAYKKNIWQHDNSISPTDIPMLASFAGCTINRECSWAAFSKLGRSVQTSDMIPEIGPSFQRLFER